MHCDSTKARLLRLRHATHPNDIFSSDTLDAQWLVFIQCELWVGLPIIHVLHSMFSFSIACRPGKKLVEELSSLDTAAEMPEHELTNKSTELVLHVSVPRVQDAADLDLQVLMSS